MMLEARIAAMAAMSAAEKKAAWRRLHGKSAPAAFGAGLLTRALALAHRMQEKTHRGQSKSTQRQIAQLLAQVGSPELAPVSLKPGTWLSRNWHGQVHQVIVLDNGFEYRGERFASLTAIARRISGTGWSGPRFFGLRSPRLGKLEVTGNG
jgi:hypothetical protein